MNTFGNKFRISIFGESHGGGIGVVMDGVTAGMPLATADFEGDLGRRRAGKPGTTPRREDDAPEILSGVFEGRTTGAPLAVMFRNANTRSGDYGDVLTHPRPGHADWVAMTKYGGHNDHRGGGHFSGRITLGLVAAGVVAKKMLGGVTIDARIVQIGTCTDPACFEGEVAAAMAGHDSVGGIIECTVSGVAPGLGEPFFDGVESVAAHLLFSVPAVKGVEFGAGFGAASLKGSQNNDPIVAPDGRTATNNAGGINGGITNGNPIVVRVAIKPTPSIGREQCSLNTHTGKPEPFTIAGRHDACIALRAPVIVEAAMAIALAQF